jgi:DNA (cytosine-5)-methyltransferase 1
MGIDWMTGGELSEAVPPAYAEFVGRQLMLALGSEREVEMAESNG